MEEAKIPKIPLFCFFFKNCYRADPRPSCGQAIASIFYFLFLEFFYLKIK
jgi:hypothetical protein